MSKSRHGKHVANLQRKIARRLHKGEAISAGLAQTWPPCWRTRPTRWQRRAWRIWTDVRWEVEINTRVVFLFVESV
jgi:hypothetical protein